MSNTPRNKRKGRTYPKLRHAIKKRTKDGEEITVGHEQRGRTRWLSQPLKKDKIHIGPNGQEYYVNERGELRRIRHVG